MKYLVNKIVSIMVLLAYYKPGIAFTTSMTYSSPQSSFLLSDISLNIVIIV
jgi:hypothetical protein